jgi:Protein of unknown function (DUF2971)
MIRYKFTRAENAFYTLFDRRMKASKPNEFNDVFEFCPKSDPRSCFQHTLNQLRGIPVAVQELYDSECREGYTQTLEYFQKYDLEKKWADHFKHDALSTWDLKAREEGSKYVAVICLSRSCRMYLQWSYYADCHRGCAIGVDVEHPCFGKARINEEVTYVKDRPTYFWGLDKEANLKQIAALTKSKSEVWKHEREHRLAYPLKDLTCLGAHYFVDLDPQAVRRVVYGSQIDPDQKRRIEKVLQHRDFAHVFRYVIEPDPQKYSLRQIRLSS